MSKTFASGVIADKAGLPVIAIMYTFCNFEWPITPS